MYEHTIDRLAAEGLAMYEISNFARPGHESRHNLVYWANDAYFGVGLGAARYVGGVRSTNTRDLPAYLRRIEAGLDADRPDRDARPRGPGPRDGRPDAPPDRSSASTATTSAARTGFDLDALAGAAICPARRRRAARGRRPPRPVHPRGALPRRHRPLRPPLTAPSRRAGLALREGPGPTSDRRPGLDRASPSSGAPRAEVRWVQAEPTQDLRKRG